MSTDLRNVPLESLQGQDYGTSHFPVVIPGKSKRNGHITILQHGQVPDCTSVYNHALGWGHIPTGGFPQGQMDKNVHCGIKQQEEKATHFLLIIITRFGSLTSLGFSANCW